jgi:signal transduction histidine kinase/DNA-binding response OmpR family regulator
MTLFTPLALLHLGTALVMGTFTGYLALRPHKDAAARWLIGSGVAWTTLEAAYVALGVVPAEAIPAVLSLTWVGPPLAFWCTLGFLFHFLGGPSGRGARVVLATAAVAALAAGAAMVAYFLSGLEMPWAPTLNVSIASVLLLSVLSVAARRATAGGGSRWRRLRDPATREARAFRALLMVYALPVVHGVLITLHTLGVLDGSVTSVSVVLAQVYMTLGLLVVFVNHVPEPTSFRVKVVGYALALVATAMTLGALAVFPAELVRPASISSLFAVDPDVRALHDARATRYGLLTVGAFVAVLVTLPLFLRTSVTRPLERLLGGLRRVDEGDLSARVPVRTHDEIGTLADGFNRMTASLREHTENLEGLVAERTADLARLDADKSRLFANVSHEFRTPLTLTIGPLEDLRDGLHGELPADARRPVGLAIRNARRLLGLVDQLLDVARLDAGAVRLSAARVDLGAAVGRTVEAFHPLAERLGVGLTSEALDAPVAVDLDVDQFDKVMANLLSNAFKFTPRGGEIHVALSATDHVARVAVSDTGPGIPPEDVPHVFDRFYRADEADPARGPGTGIGLSLARELVELHGGSIRVESEVGVGSRFVVSLPRAVGAGGLGGDGQPRPVAVEAGALLPGRDGDGPAAPAPPEPGDDATTVLVVDDHPGIRAYVGRHLGAARDGRAPYRIVEARDGAEGLALARAHLPDLVVSDVMMPGTDGVELCRALKAEAETDFIPVVLLTAKAGEEATLAGLGVGADDYVTKPFNVRALAARVDNLIDGRRKLRDRLADAPAPRPPLPDGLDPETAAFLRSVQAAVEDGLADEDFGVDALAEAVGVSRSVLYRRFEPLDETPNRYLRNARLARADRLLRDRAGGVGEVAYAVGFKSVAHFSRAFREVYGVPPSAVAEASAG